MTSLVSIGNLHFKREDQNLTGSAKDRAIAVQIKYLLQKGFNHTVISSTGNAAISAIYFCQKKHLRLDIFISPKIDPQKLKLIQSSNFPLHPSLKPISDAIKFSHSQHAYLLRQSTDPQALVGYQTIGTELTSQLPQISSVFIAVGSGATLLGISQGISQKVKLFAAQSAANCPFAKIFDQNFLPETKIITDAISVKTLPLKDRLISAIKSSKGSALVLQNQNILAAQSNLQNMGIQTSLEGALALAAYYKAVDNHFDVGPNPVIVLTGTKR